MLELRVARVSQPTGRILEAALREEGVRLGPGGGIVSYGVQVPPGPRVLNSNAGRLNKFQQITKLIENRILVPETFKPGVGTNFNRISYPWLARKINHVGGRDIMLVLQESDFLARLRAGADFFTKYIPRAAEFRCWIYRRQHLGTYQKVLAHPEQYKGVGCNYDNGFAFQLVGAADIPRPAVDLAAKAVTALDLDFGMVDILQGLDGEFYVLEVNTAAGVEGIGRQCIQSLAAKIARWEQLGFPRRNGDRDAQ